jgi:hypothetical protein
MSEIKFSEKEFFIPVQDDKAQRDKVYREIILEFAIQHKIISKSTADNWQKSVGKVYTITNLKEGKKYTFTVGEMNPFGGQILAIIYSEKFYAVINFDRRTESLDYSMLSLDYNSDIVMFDKV